MTTREPEHDRDRAATAALGETARKVLGEIDAVVRRSDTFQWLTTEGAQQLTYRANAREGAISKLRNAAQAQTLSEVDVNPVLTLAELEISLQRRLVRWLERQAERGAG